MANETLPARYAIAATGKATATTAIAANGNRVGWSIQNQGTNPLFVKLGASATTADYSYVLAASAGAQDGSGGSVEEKAGVVYTGVITVAGTTPTYSYVEITEV